VDRAAQESGAERIITTEKDAVRMPAFRERGEMRRPILALGVDLEVTEGVEWLDGVLARCLAPGRGAGDAPELRRG
jgi:tetraacyldisaccharide-1-P 4'-kinase